MIVLNGIILFVKGVMNVNFGIFYIYNYLFDDICNM